MRVAVTGLNGFTGGYLAEVLATRGHAVLSLDAELTDAAAVAAQMETIAPDAIVHLAGMAFVQSDDFGSFYKVNQLGTFHLLDAAARSRPGSRVLLASTAQVYGGSASGVVDEGEPADPHNHYALSKWAMELGARMWADRLRITVVRPFNYTGVGQEDRYLVPKIVAHFRRQADTIELGNMDVQRDYGDVRTVAEAYAGLVEHDAPPPVLNIATGRAHSVREIVALAERLTGHTLEVRFNPAFARSNDVPMLIGDNDLLRRTLPAWQPRPIEDTLAWMLNA